jgi:hypothetical protein
VSQIGNRTLRGKYIDAKLTFPLANSTEKNKNITFNMTCFLGRLSAAEKKRINYDGILGLAPLHNN